MLEVNYNPKEFQELFYIILKLIIIFFKFMLFPFILIYPIKKDLFYEKII